MYHTEFCKVSYQKNLNAILCEWKAFCKGKEYREPLLYGLNLLASTKASSWVTDTTHGFKNRLEDTEWLLETFIPQTIESSCKNLFFIMAEDSTLKEEIEGQAAALGEYFNIYIIESMQEVEAILGKNFIDKIPFSKHIGT
ncbi:MAG TPA: hypothetical protein ENK87_03325 [Nitratifractor sp.]|nr:hypothetical protein [Nitratifractor sp.]